MILLFSFRVFIWYPFFDIFIYPIERKWIKIESIIEQASTWFCCFCLESLYGTHFRHFYLLQLKVNESISIYRLRWRVLKLLTWFKKNLFSLYSSLYSFRLVVTDFSLRSSTRLTFEIKIFKTETHCKFTCGTLFIHVIHIACCLCCVGAMVPVFENNAQFRFFSGYRNSNIKNKIYNGGKTNEQPV